VKIQFNSNPNKISIMNKTDLVNKIAENAGLTKADAKKALDATLEAVANALVEGDKVALLGFGTFSVNERPARTGVNPATKQKIEIAAKKVVKFKAGAELADKVK
jgi:DNA-binding protein HU-beta